MNSKDFCDAAIAIDNHILRRTDRADYALVQRLSKEIYDATPPGSDRNYPGLSHNIPVFMNPVENYFDKKFEQGSKIKDLADKLILISENLERFVLHEEETQRKLMYFCVEVSKNLRIQQDTYQRRLVA